MLHRKLVQTAFSSKLFACLRTSRRNVIQFPFVGVSDDERLLRLIEQRCRPDLVQELERINSELSELKELKVASKNDLDQMVDDEINQIQEKKVIFLSSLLDTIARDEDFYVQSLVLEVNNGVGGQEAMLFAGELLNVYQNYIANKGWTCEILAATESPLGGISSATLKVEGKQCFQFLRHEAGVHRVQRVPKTERTGRIHTSTITVNVLPIKGDELNPEINPKELKIDSKRSTGAGGQHVNKTESCAIVTHIPTGIVVECQEGRHFMANKDEAIRKLKASLFLRNKQKLYSEEMKRRKEQVSSAARSDKVRTYNFVQDRITDHRLSENIFGIKELFEKSDSDKMDHLMRNLDELHKGEMIENLIKNIN